MTTEQCAAAMAPRPQILSEILTCRRILLAMLVMGFIVNAMLTALPTIAIVAMVKSENGTRSDFDWNEDQKQNILGVFFWGFAICKIPAGRLSEIIGPRKVIGYSTLLSAILTILTPPIAFWNYHMLLASRVVMGLLLGPIFPAFLPLTARWFCHTSQSKCISCMEAVALGMGLTYVISGFLIAQFGWPSVFYVIGSFALLWSILWFFLIYDGPEEHPRISEEERKTVDLSLGEHVMRKPNLNRVPWKQILLSPPVWAIVVVEIAHYFTYITLTNELPTYMDQVFGLEIKENGLYSSIPQAGKYFLSIVFAYAGDGILKSGRLSVGTIRKIYETIGLLLPGIFIMFNALFADNMTVSMAAFVLTVTLGGACVSGHYANMLDIAPNFSGTISGLVYTASSFTAYLSTKFVAVLLADGQKTDHWHYLFWLLSALNFLGCIAYLFFSSGKLQKWDCCDENELPEKNL